MKPAFPTVIVATGTPLGICNVDKRESKPVKMPPSNGTPITGNVDVDFIWHKDSDLRLYDLELEKEKTLFFLMM